jgi:hypothetical protein
MSKFYLLYAQTIFKICQIWIFRYYVPSNKLVGKFPQSYGPCQWQMSFSEVFRLQNLGNYKIEILKHTPVEMHQIYFLSPVWSSKCS